VVPLLEDPNAEREHSALTSFTYPGNKTGHALRGNRYRYIYYEWNSLEELYDHDSDPNEFTNLAYDPTLAGVIEQFRNEMVSRVSRVSLDEMLERPSGYTVSNGRVSVDGFIPMAQVPLPKERPKKESIR
jgi:hypothetical protein